jgi:hypothetical protein
MRVFHLLREEVEFLYQTIFEDDEYLRHGIVLDEHDTVVDVGGNVGLFSLYCYRKLNGHVRLLAFEPLPPIYRVLEQNFASFNSASACTESSSQPSDACGAACLASADSPPALLALPYGLSSRAQPTVRFSYYPCCSLWSSAHADISEGELAQVSELVMRNLQQAGTHGKLFASLLRWCPVASLRRLLVHSVVRRWNQVEEYQCALRTLSSVVDEHGLQRIDLLKVSAGE